MAGQAGALVQTGVDPGPASGPGCVMADRPVVGNEKPEHVPEPVADSTGNSFHKTQNSYES